MKADSSSPPAIQTKADKLVHAGFDVGLILKTLSALSEVIGGFAICFFPPSRVNALIEHITQRGLSKDPKAPLLNLLVHFGSSFGISSWHFVIFYLLSHGLVKLIVLFLLWKKVLWAYPLSIVVLIGFMIYQIYKLAMGGSLFLLLLTFLDAFMIVFTILEYKRIRKERAVTRV